MDLKIVCSYFKIKFGLFQSLKPAPHLFAQLSKVLKLSKVQEVSDLRKEIDRIRNKATICTLWSI